MKRLIVCCDGTWNTPDQTDDGICTPTNVVKIFNAVDDLSNDNGIGQIKYYHPGVGSDEGLIKKITGGITGKGIDKIIMSAYSWLCRNYQPGDDIFFFGFSRGAFTVRSVSGLINKCSLLDLQPYGLILLMVRKENRSGFQESMEMSVAGKKKPASLMEHFYG